MARKAKTIKLDRQVIVVTPTKIYGPFQDQSTAETWIFAPHDIGPVWSIFSIWQREVGNETTAHECGNMLMNHLDK